MKCVSNSTSLQTQQQALIVMASVANFFPVSTFIISFYVKEFVKLLSHVVFSLFLICVW